MKTIAFAVALVILALGAAILLVPSSVFGLARSTLNPAAFCVIGALRVALGLVFVSAAAASRAPKTLRVLGIIIVLAGIATALTGLLAMERARALIEWWLAQGSGVVRVAGVVVVALGGFLAYACAPVRRAPSSEA